MEVTYIVRHFNVIQSRVLLFKLFCIRKMNTRGPLVCVYIYNGTLDVVYELKGAPCVYSDSNGDDFGK